MSSPDENTPATGAEPLPDAAGRPAEPPGERPGAARKMPAGHKPAGQAALEQALSQSGKHLEDLTGEPPDRPRG
ncbi:hypothetical protein [Nonomuraea sp. NPDC049684]|uniref:hypothetical protein n=1 Tax=Nonomuraea sp. NPDC049684 TaxID=3364356 RepID=UPI0037AB0750